MTSHFSVSIISIIRKTIFPRFPKRSVINRAKILKRNGCSKINHATIKTKNAVNLAAFFAYKLTGKKY